MLTISPSEFLRVTFAASPSGDSYWYSIHFIRSTGISTNTTVIKGSRINHIGKLNWPNLEIQEDDKA